MNPPVMYAKSGDLQIAYSVSGSGPVDLVWTPGFVSHLDMQMEMAHFRRLHDLFASFSRLIRFDKRGTGLSDRPAGIPDLEERIDDIRAVMDAAKSERAHVFGISEGLPMSILFAATYPRRVRSLILYGGRLRFTRAPDYPWGPTEEESERALQTWIERGFRDDYTTPQMRHWLGPACADDHAFIEQWDRLVRGSATPQARIQLSRMNRKIDVRGITPSVRVPTLFICKSDDPVMPVDCARDLTSRIPGARLVVMEGTGHIFFDKVEEIAATMREWVTAAAAPVETDRFLATVMFVDMVGSTERVAAIGDAAWRDLLARYHTVARRQLALFGGIEVDTAGDGMLAHFDGPGRAIRCARAIERGAKDLGIQVRAGLHTGEVERDGSAIRGIAVHLASRIAGLGSTAEILVSNTVRDLVAGSGFEFAERGTHQLKGIPEPRQVLAVA
jgi:pimeloyl-ACP methyl ester carboxylesterase